MQFRLLIKGQLPPGNKSGIKDIKHQIRREIHPQLQALWKQHYWLSQMLDGHLESRSNHFARYGFRFFPLILKNEAVVALDVLILSRKEPFRVTDNIGDLDGRVKTLLDGLRMPSQPGEVNDLVPEDGEDPLFVLMEDDSSIVGLNIAIDRLYVPQQSGEAFRDVVAIIHVKTKSLATMAANPFDSGSF